MAGKFGEVRSIIAAFKRNTDRSCNQRLIKQENPAQDHARTGFSVKGCGGVLGETMVPAALEESISLGSTIRGCASKEPTG